VPGSNAGSHVWWPPMESTAKRIITNTEWRRRQHLLWLRTPRNKSML